MAIACQLGFGFAVVPFTCITRTLFCISDYPPAVLDAGKGHSAESMKKKFDDAAFIIKNTYW